ncbi:hypothetical protein SLEP1_g43103 [Rubroshorea leprosula]|uniref:Uncharacterized protein n=1 Tax=Rubroshorea leprosula TaxID=152421 RepID=A0AAV5LCD1_9ROSI|nr:hypothetical protein SLEP1_g43103 [Rubroshorea leprosula]
MLFLPPMIASALAISFSLSSPSSHYFFLLQYSFETADQRLVFDPACGPDTKSSKDSITLRVTVCAPQKMLNIAPVSLHLFSLFFKFFKAFETAFFSAFLEAKYFPTSDIKDPKRPILQLINTFPMLLMGQGLLVKGKQEQLLDIIMLILKAIEFSQIEDHEVEANSDDANLLKCSSTSEVTGCDLEGQLFERECEDDEVEADSADANLLKCSSTSEAMGCDLKGKLFERDWQ